MSFVVILAMNERREAKTVYFNTTANLFGFQWNCVTKKVLVAWVFSVEPVVIAFFSSQSSYRKLFDDVFQNINYLVYVKNSFLRKLFIT